MAWQPNGFELIDPVNAHFRKLNLNSGKYVNFFEPKSIVDGYKSKIKYPQYLSASKQEDAGKYKQIENKDHAKNDKGHLGDKEFKNLFKGDKIITNDLSPNLGTEIEGIQLSELDDAAKNDLALYLETRGLAIFRNQDLKDKDPQVAIDFGKYFGPLHIHPVAYSVEDHPELLVTFRPPGGEERYEKQYANSDFGGAWHSDISFEEHPASFSFFVALEAPKSGGDTVYIDLREAYKRLSPTYQVFLESLTAIHSNYYQNTAAKYAGSPSRVDGEKFTEHPLIRTHPVTGEKSIFYSRGFIQRIKGAKPKESSSILNFLEQHILSNPEIQVRAQHKGTDAGTIIAWDNRFLLHTATLDFLQHETTARHHYRITVAGERPYLDQESQNGVSNGSNGHSIGSNGHSNGTSESK